MPSPKGWLAVPTNASRRFLVAAGTEHYDDGEELASVPEDLRKMAGFFGQLGYCEQLPEVRLDPSSSALRRALSEWLNGTDRQASDTAVIYYSGHGDSQASYFYLLTADSKKNRYADTALRADFVLEALGENPRVRRLLLILDACYAGQGAFDAAEVAARMAPYMNFSADDEGVWVVAAASPKQEAQERLFADAFIEAAEQLQQTTGTLQPYIGLEALIWQINAILKRNGMQQRASWVPATQARSLAPFIPNLRYEPDARANVDLETRRRHAAELAEYWGPKARGVEVAAQAGWYFTGRRAALAELSRWLADPAADTRLRVVTGDPGSGKSAVLGRLITIADTSRAAKPSVHLLAPGPVPPAGSITAALLARGKTAEELLAELAASLGIAASTRLADTVLKRPVFTVVIDALDEAADPPAVIEKVISPLHGVASPGRGPRLLVATRRYQHLLGSLPAARVTVDLDQDTYHNDTDTADYVTKVLLAADDPDATTPYRGQPDLARLVASQIAEIARHSFLIAQIAARTLARTAQALDPAEVSADRESWRDVGAAFDRDLDRFGENADRVRDLLAPLAWAEGAGLPRELWAPLARALAGDQHYADEDITWLLEHAGFYLVETLAQDRSVYRLYHEQFAEHLRAGRSPRFAHERITVELLRHVPATAEGRREWPAAAPYIRTHLATHAAKARVLDPLVNDPGFLLAADPTRLLPALATVTDSEARRSASAFESIQHLLPDQSLRQATAQLDLAARVHGASTLIDGIRRLPYKRPWTITWGHWIRPDRQVRVGSHGAPIKAMMLATIEDVPIAFTGGSDGAVRAWDLRARTVYEEPRRGHTGSVEAMVVAKVDGALITVVADHDGMRIWDLQAEAALGGPFRGTGSVRAAAVGEVDSIAVIVTGSLYGTVQAWNLRSGELRWEAPDVRRGSGGTREMPHWDTHWVRHWGPRPPGIFDGESVIAVAIGEVDGTPIAVTGSSRGRVRMWDLRTGTQRGKTLRSQSHAIEAVVIGEVDGTPIAVTGGADGIVRAWNLRSWAPWWQTPRDYFDIVRTVAIGEVDGIPVALSGGSRGVVRMWDLRTGISRGEPLRGYSGWVEAVAVGDVDGIPMAVTGSSDGTVQMWNLRAEAGLEWQDDEDNKVEAVAVGKVDGTLAAVTGGPHGVRIWDLHTGAHRGEPFHTQTGGILAIAVGEVDGTPLAVTSGSAGLLVWDLQARATQAALSRRDKWVGSGIAVGDVDGTPVAVTGGRNGRLRVWDLRTGTARKGPLRGHTKHIDAVAMGEVDGIPVAAAGASDGTVRVWDLRTGTARGEALRGHTRSVRALTIGKIDGTPLLVSGASDGTVRVWDLRTGTARGEALRGHTGSVEAVAIGMADGTPVLVTGDNNGTILISCIDRGQCASTRLDAPAGITAITFAGQAGWLTSTGDGSIFTWSLASLPEHEIRVR